MPSPSEAREGGKEGDEVRGRARNQIQMAFPSLFSSIKLTLPSLSLVLPRRALPPSLPPSLAGGAHCRRHCDRTTEGAEFANGPDTSDRFRGRWPRQEPIILRPLPWNRLLQLLRISPNLTNWSPAPLYHDLSSLKPIVCNEWFIRLFQ